MGIKLSDYINDPSNVFTDDEWFEIFKRAYIDIEDETVNRLEEALKEVEDIQEGKVPKKTAREFLNELKNNK